MRPVILLVEDRADDRYLMRWLLSHFDAEICEAHNGRMALDAMREARPCLVVLDLGLPDMDGVELLRHLRGLPDCGEIPIVVVTARALPEERRLAMAVGCNAYLAKPVDPGTLRAVVEALLEPVKVDS
ncbi:response regulator [Wenzhouxiangella sp. XN24]|uniref:response regulator n=1 Tax=Wenzhouxiangella sp. XN24 TaxID=2713569 RepID=UPI0013EC2C3E|nr:response regulator [Wenzhouxiangella sp. XN24]NGX15757.1 response regulator [Wenzhouxiangella sp. XN24]